MTTGRNLPKRWLGAVVLTLAVAGTDAPAQERAAGPRPQAQNTQRPAPGSNNRRRGTEELVSATKFNQLNHILGKAIELTDGNGGALWRYDYGSAPKPFFHPLNTPRGFTLSLFQPADHIWHRGLWFTIKFINGENFWEEDGAFGRQVTAVPPTVEHEAGGAFSWTSRINWERPNNQGAVLRETRRITYRPLEDGSYSLDWDIKLRAVTDALLDRTPFTTWGGYSGLIIRGNRNWMGTKLLFPDGTTDDRPKGKPAQWCDFTGTFDGAANATGGIALFDHPENSRHPVPWYGATGAGHYINAAFIFHEPMQLKAGQILEFHHRALIHDGTWDVPQIQKAYDGYAARKPRPLADPEA